MNMCIYQQRIHDTILEFSMIKKAVCIFLFVSSCVFVGCAKQPLTDKEFSFIWNEYLSREFSESFDEKQSASQREKLLAEVCKKYSIDPSSVRDYMKTNQSDKYNKLFAK